MKISRVINYLRYNIPIYFIQLFCSFLPNHGIIHRVRGFLISPFFKKCGKNFILASGVIIQNPQNIIIGNNVYIAHNVWINADSMLQISDGVVIGPFTVIATTKHLFKNGKVSLDTTSRSISINEGVWIASHVVLTDGITVGKGSIIAAGAIVTKDIEANSLCGGVPAKVISKLNENQ